MLNRALHLLTCPLLAAGCVSSSSAATFEFGSQANALSGIAAASLEVDGVTLSIAVDTPLVGSVLDERGRRGLGLNSRGIPGGGDPDVDKFNVLSGPPGLAGVGEAITLSFDTAGVLTSLDFDGVKDESFEYFQLDTPRDGLFTFFDSQIGLRLLDIGSIDEPNVTLLLEEPGGTIDDELDGLSFSFGPGEVFTLTYGEYFPDSSELAPSFTPEIGNGARLEGLTVLAVPEPAAAIMAALILASSAWSRRAA